MFWTNSYTNVPCGSIYAKEMKTFAVPDARQAVEELEALAKAHPDSTTIAAKYARSLVNPKMRNRGGKSARQNA